LLINCCGKGIGGGRIFLYSVLYSYG